MEIRRPGPSPVCPSVLNKVVDCLFGEERPQPNILLFKSRSSSPRPSSPTTDPGGPSCSTQAGMPSAPQLDSDLLSSPFLGPCNKIAFGDSLFPPVLFPSTPFPKLPLYSG